MHNKAVTSERDINHIIINSLLDIKSQLLQKDWGNRVHTVPYQSFQLPRTARELVHLIDETVKTSPVPAESPLIDTLKRISEIPALREEYSDTKAMADALIGVVLLMTEEMISHEMGQYDRPESKVEKAYFSNLAVQLKLMQSQKEAGLPEVDILVETRQNLTDLKENYLHELLKPERQQEAQKEAKFFREKINPFYEQLENQENKAFAVNQDLQICVNAMIAQTMHPEKTIVSTRMNGLDELEVIIGNDLYNLTQILKHDPNFSQLEFDAAQLDTYAAHMSKLPILGIDNFPVQQFERNVKGELSGVKTPAAMQSELNALIREKGKENVFENCHIAHCMAINLYTSDAYIVLNELLRHKTMPPDLFVPKKMQDPVTVQALRAIEKRLRGSNTGGTLTAYESNLLTQQAIMATAVASAGLTLAKPVVFEPGKAVSINLEGELDTTQGRMVRGAAGNWVADTRKQYAFANEAGMPVYYDGFMSSSFSTNIANQFMTDKSKTLMSKVNTYSIDLQSGSGVVVSDISRYRKENEYLFPPGSLILPNKESAIKHKEHYGHIGKERQITSKVSQVVTSGNSSKLQYYSPAIQQKRMALIQEYEKIEDNHSLPQQERKEKLEALTQEIQQLETQLKRIDIVVMQSLPDKPDIHALCKEADAVFLMAENGETLFLDKQANKATPLTLDTRQKEKLVKSLELPAHARQLQDNNDSVHAFNKLDLIKIAWLEKVTHWTVDKAFSEKTTLEIHDETFQILEAYALKSVSMVEQHAAIPVTPDISASFPINNSDVRIAFQTTDSPDIPSMEVTKKAEGNETHPAPAPEKTPAKTNATQDFKERLASLQQQDSPVVEENRWRKLS